MTSVPGELPRRGVGQVEGPALASGERRVPLRHFAGAVGVAAAHHRLALVWADGGYTGSLAEHCLATFAVLAIVKRSDDTRGFVVLLSERWIVERLFAHLCALAAWPATTSGVPPVPRR